MQIMPRYYSAAIHGIVICSMQPQGDLRCNIMTNDNMGSVAYMNGTKKVLFVCA